MTSTEVKNIIALNAIEIPKGQYSIEVQGDKPLYMFSLGGVSMYYTELFIWSSIQKANFMLNGNIIASLDFTTIKKLKEV